MFVLLAIEYIDNNWSIHYFTEDDLPPIDDADEILSSEPILREKLRPKLLSFHENRRPPYWGTWRKKSVAVKPRRPFHQDQVSLKFLMLFGTIQSMQM